MAHLRAIWKLLLWIPVVIGLLATNYFWKLTVFDHIKRRRLFALTVSWFCRRILWFTHSTVKVINMPPEHHPFLLVGNHLGFFDIILLASIRPCLFITSVEMKETPLLGTMCEMGGCVFVERRTRNNITKEIGVIREALKQDFNVVLYAEGTSTNGEKLLPFKKSLMTAAAGTGVPILPMVLNFRRVNDEPMSVKWRDNVCWYGDQAFFPALWRMMSLKSLHAEIEFLRPIVCENEDQRRHISQDAYDQINEKFVKII